MCQAGGMPAPFIAQLCGFRAGGNPNTSDNGDAQSKELGRELFEVLGIPSEQPGPENAGALLEQHVRGHIAGLRPDLVIGASAPAASFEQYEHLSVFPRYRRGHQISDEALNPLVSAVASLSKIHGGAEVNKILERVTAHFRDQDLLALELIAQMPEESLLKIDITAAERRSSGPSRLHVALSSKWSLRTDRAQDCVTQGSKLVGHRRGRMPHFAVVTMEPRPSMLRILGDGSGSVDCVYHLNLGALQEALERLAIKPRRNPSTWSPLMTFHRLVKQRRLRDYDDLIAEVKQLPTPIP